jgi:undecaprenyl-diphosphatase
MLIQLIYAILLGIVEGITEFLPVSSTGHLRLCEAWMHLDLKDEQWKLFTVFIQIGAILAVIVYFRERILTLLRGRPARETALTPLEASLGAESSKSIGAANGGGSSTSTATAVAESISGEPPPGARYWVIAMILLATVPALIVGKLAHEWVSEHMESPAVIAWALLVGGVIMAIIEFLPLPVTTTSIESISLWQAIGIGCTQVLAILFPGTSRSAATIMPGMLAGLSRQAATEFSFFLAIPAMFAACGYDLYKHRHEVTLQRGLLLVIGTLVSFLVAWVVIAAFMNYIRRHNFIPFAVYRVLLGLVVFMTL